MRRGGRPEHAILMLLAVSGASARGGDTVSQFDRARGYSSGFYRIVLCDQQPSFLGFLLDGLGRGWFGADAILDEPHASDEVRLESTLPGEFCYLLPAKGGGETTVWRIHCAERVLTLSSEHRPGVTAPPLRLKFQQKASHATLLGRCVPGARQIELPCVLHLPGRGSARITGTSGVPLDYDARRYVQPAPFVTIAFPAASAEHPSVSYQLEVDAIYPHLDGLTDEPLFDGFKRGFLNIFQVNPRLGMLANNASSDAVPFTLFEYAEMAKLAPPLLPGLTCMDLVRATLDRYLAGAKGYGMSGYGAEPSDADLVAWTTPYDSLDTYPSLLIAASEYLQATQDAAWGNAHFAALQAWAERMVAGDRDQNGLIEYPRSGNLGDRPTPGSRPANWWDCINFGHEDAYANALAYRAATVFADAAERLGHAREAARCRSFAARLRSAYLPAFLDPDSGLLAGWRSKDGKRHDYAFTFVQGVAITYGLVPADTANAIMDRLLAKLRAVGFHDFALGLPGNLIAVPKGDYVQHGWANAIGVGEPSREDGTDAFQIYENGGATGCYAYFTVKALYQLGRSGDARRIFEPMLKSYAEGAFDGFGANGNSKDWRDWSGVCHGYEGLLVDSYLALLCVADELRSR